MRKSEQTCKECGKLKESIICDTCGENLIKEFFGIPVYLIYGYGSNLDGNEYHFCSNKCLFRFVAEELKKENPENRFEYGKEKE